MTHQANTKFLERHTALHLLQRQNARADQLAPSHSRHNTNHSNVLANLALRLPTTHRQASRKGHPLANAHPSERRRFFRRQRTHHLNDSRDCRLRHVSPDSGRAIAPWWGRQAGSLQAESSWWRDWNEYPRAQGHEKGGCQRRGA
jgi:hypothetical protein